MPQSKSSREVYDAVVVGAGAGGGTTVKVLTDLGMKVCLLEAGPMLDPETEFKEHATYADYDHRGAEPGGGRYFGESRSPGFMMTASGGFELPGEPYTVGEGSQFWWFRSRIVGGRTNHYGRMSFRFSQMDLKARDRDGLGANWPIDYSDLSPYYDKVEKFIGVTGSVEGIPSAPDGIFQDPPAPKVHEHLAREAGKRMGIRFIANRRAIVTNGVSGRIPCHYCGQCARGCRTASAYSSSQVEIFPALETGNLELITDAMAREVSVDRNGKPNGVIYVDKNTRLEKQVFGKAVFVAASACESARLLMNSKSKYHRTGLANSSGQLGRNLMDNVGFGLSGSVPALEGMPRYNTDGFGSGHLYAPWWGWDDHSKLGFPRGYHIEFGGGFRLPEPGSYHGLARSVGYGVDIKRRARENYGVNVRFNGRGEMIPNDLSYCEIDPDVVDQWGIPVLKFHFQWSDYEWKQARHMQRTFAEIIDGMGGEVRGVPNVRERDGISVPGSIIHELGPARMGFSPKDSLLNRFNQAWDAKNLFVVDGASMPTAPDKNPTLTINALAWRAAEYYAEAAKRGDV